MPTPTYTPLATITLSSAQSSVSFASIPNTFRDLIVVCNWANSGTASATRVQLNGDSAANYFGVWMTGTGSATGSSAEASETSSRAGGSQVGPDNAFTNIMTLQFLDANATDKHKTYLVRFGSGNRETHAVASRYASTARIQSIRIFDILGQTFQTGATFSLYGVAA